MNKPDLDERDIMRLKDAMKSFIDRFEKDLGELKSLRYPLLPTYDQELSECRMTLKKLEGVS